MTSKAQIHPLSEVRDFKAQVDMLEAELSQTK